MTSTVRSVTVRMNAEVADYVAKMRLAGKATDDAFAGGHRGLTTLNRDLDENQRKFTTTNRTLGDTERAMRTVDQATQRHSKSLRTATTDLNQYTGRLNLLLTAVTTLGPGLIPLTAGLIPATTGLAAGFGAAAGAAGVAILAFHGVADAVKAVDAYRLQPTTQNLAKMRLEFEKLGPAGAEFSVFVDRLSPELRDLQNASREGLFPGVEAGIKELLPLLPEAERVIAGISNELGHLAEEAGHGLANDASFQRFFHYLETDAAPTMDAFAKATGHVASGLASLIVDFAPIDRDFAGGMEHAAESFDHWAAGLDKTQGFRDFLAYLERTGPQVVQFMKGLGEASLGLVHAAQPIGSVVLPALTALANVIGVIGKSPLGPMIYTAVAGMLVLSRTSALAATAIDRLAASWLGVGAAARTAAVAQETAALASVGGAAGAARTAKITGVGSLLAASPLVAGAGSRLGAGLTAAGTAGLAAYLTGNAVGGTINFAGNHLDPSAKDLGSRDNVNAVRNSLAHGWQSKFLDPTAFIGFNPLGLGNKKPVQSADIGLAQMVSNGQTEQAAAIFKKFGVSVQDAAKRFPNYTAAVAASTAATKTEAAATDVSTMSMKQLRDSLVDTTLSTKNYNAAQAQLHQQTLSNFDAITSFGSAVQAAAKQAASGQKSLNQFTAAGVANRQALSGMIAAYNAQPDSVKKNAAAYEGARAKLVQLATQMGATKGEIAALARQMDEPLQVRIAIAGEDRIASLKAQLAALHDKTINVKVNSTTANLSRHGQLDGVGADGTTVPKTGLPYADRHLYMVADGEEVVSNRYGQADRYRRALKAINANAAPSTIKGMLADGGTAGGGLIGATTASIGSAQSTSGLSAAAASTLKEHAAATKAATGSTKKLTQAQLEQIAAGHKATAELSRLKLDVSGLAGKEFKDLRKGLRDLVGKDLRLAGDSLKDLNKASKLLTTAYDNQKQALDSVVAQRDSLVSAVTSSLTRDLWNVPTTGSSSVFSMQSKTWTPQYAIDQLNGEKSDADREGQLLQAVQKNGISGPALDELLAKGGLTALEAFAKSPDLSRQYEQAYTSASSAIGSVSKAAGDAVYAKQIGDIRAEVKSLRGDVKDVTRAIKDKEAADHASRTENAHATVRGVGGAAATGHKHRPKPGAHTVKK